MLYPNDDDFYPDPFTGKRAGETQEEAKKRQDDEYRQKQEEIRKMQEEEIRNALERKIKNKGNDQPDITIVNNPNERRTVFAGWIARIGILLLSIGCLLWVLHFFVGAIQESWALELMKSGAFCLILVIAYNWVFYLLLAVALCIFLLAGSQSPGGTFDINTVPVEGYLATIGMLAFAFIFRWIFAPRED